jgi:flagellar hook-associated protein 1 FlgK
MGTINSAFNIMSGALDADQEALNTVSNNVANANTPGYTRETPNWQENQPLQIGSLTIGQGVTETGATSVRDRVLEARLDQQQQLAAASGSRLTALDTLQALFTPDSGTSSSTAGDIGSDLTHFFDTFSSLEANPTNNSLRQSILSSASTLAGDISNASASLSSQRAALDQEAAGVTSQVNSLTSAIAQLNQEIQTSSPNADAGTLEDQRQEDLSKLSQLIGINQITTENNGLAITTTSGQLLVSEGTSFQLTTGMVNGVTNFFLGNTDITAQLTSGGGSLGGYLTVRDQDIPGVMGSLDQLAYGVSTQVNAMNNAGTDLDGAEGTGVNQAGIIGTGTTPLYIFNQPTQVAGSAASMSVVMTDPNQIAAAGFGAGTGDNTNATLMSNLANQPISGQLATTYFSMTQNLDAATPINGSTTGQVEVYDSLGKGYEATVTYTHTAANSWSYSVTLPDALPPNTSVAGQVSYSFGAGETVNPGTNLTITGNTGGGTATIAAPVVTAGEPVGAAGPPPTGYVAALDGALTAAGIIGVTVTNNGGVLTIAGATGTAGSVFADPAASANATGTLTFDAGGNLVSPTANVNGITFNGLSDQAQALKLDWVLYGANGIPNISQSAAPSLQSAQSQNGSAPGAHGDNQTPIDFYSNFVAELGSTVSSVQTENTAQNASVTQLQTQNDALSAVNLDDEASSMTTLERSYQSASQVFAILNTVMASALNLGDQTAVS